MDMMKQLENFMKGNGTFKKSINSAEDTKILNDCDMT